jgi:osmotically inducible protein OsmC
MEKVYTAVVTAKGGRDGHIKSSDGIIDLDLKKPKEMGGEGGDFTNPSNCLPVHTVLVTWVL